jgi:hypothetical protein
MLPSVFLGPAGHVGQAKRRGVKMISVGLKLLVHSKKPVFETGINVTTWRSDALRLGHVTWDRAALLDSFSFPSLSLVFSFELHLLV